MRRTLTAVFTVLATTAVSAATLAADLAEIKSRGRLIAATSGNLPPNTFVDANNQLTGYDVEVGRLIEKAIGVPVQFERLDWKGILPGLQTGRFDAVFSNVNITDERKQIFAFSIPYSRAAVVTVVRAGVEGVNGYRDLAGKNVGAISGGADGEMPAREIDKKFGAFKSFKGYPGYAEMFTDMRAGRLDAIICPDLAAADYLVKFPGVAQIKGEPYTVRFVGIPMQKNAPELKALVDATIRKARNDGVLDQLAKKFFGLDGFSKQLVDQVP